MIKIQATFAGYSGKPCTLFSAYDKKARVLAVTFEKDYRTERSDGCIVLTNLPDLPRDTLFTDADLLPAIAAFQSLKNGVAADGKSARLNFDDSVNRANPEQSIEYDGMDASGPRYRVASSISCGQIAALATCLYASRCETIASAVTMADSLRRILSGDIVTIG